MPELLGADYVREGVVWGGGAAEVYRALDIGLYGILPVKALWDELARNQARQARFLREAEPTRPPQASGSIQQTPFPGTALATDADVWKTAEAPAFKSGCAYGPADDDGTSSIRTVSAALRGGPDGVWCWPALRQESSGWWHAGEALGAA